MPTVKGKARTKQFFRQLPGEIEQKLLRGAARAAIGVIADEAAERVTSDEVRENFQKQVRKREDHVVATLSIKAGWPRSLANWLEYGTEGHFISVDTSQSGGRSVRRLNEQSKGSLVIGGEPVGTTVWHPGSRPHPFLRVSLDLRGSDAVEAAQAFINARAAKLGLVSDTGDEE